jgi:probable O-glycosylation ligase (exosortase A-associated)
MQVSTADAAGLRPTISTRVKAPMIERFDSTGLLFALYAAVLLIEWIGLPNAFPIIKATRFSTISTYLLFALTLKRVGSEAFTGYRQIRLVECFVAFTAVGVLWAVVTSTAFFALRAHIDYLAFAITTVYLVDRPSRVRTMAIVAVLVIFGLCAQNVDKLMASARTAGVFQGSGFVGDGNDFAWFLGILLPLAVFLATTKQKFIYRLVGMAGAGMALFGIVATQSRGAALALAASGLFYWAFIVRRKMIGVALMAVVVVGLVIVAPPEYFERLNSIQNYREDNSAQGRLQAWGAATRMAVDFPLGVGASNFGSAYGRYYIPQGDANALTWAAGRWLSAHSVYFRLLGEYGILGVVWIFTLLAWTYRDNLASSRRFAESTGGDSLPREWPLFLNMSLVSYTVAGTFLGGLTYPHVYLLTGLSVSAMRQSLQVNATAAATGGAALALARPVGAKPGALERPVMDVAARARLMVNSRTSRG